MASPWDDDYVKANLEIISQLQTNEHLKTAENGKILARFLRMPKGGLFTKVPSLSPIEFHRPIVNVFKKGGELTGWQTVHQEKTGKTITDFKEKITKETIRGAFSGLLVLLETYKGSTQRYELVKSVITDVMNVLRQVGDMDHVYRGGWKDKIGIEGKKGKIIHKLDPKQLEVMLFQGMEALIKNPGLCNEATKDQIKKLNDQWIRNVYGNTPQYVWTQMPITGQMYQRQGSGICVQAVLDWPRGSFRHPMGGLELPGKYLPFGNSHKAVDASDSVQVKAIYNDVGRNSAMLFVVSQLTNQAVIGNVPQLYLAFNGDEDHECPPVLWYKNVGVLFMSGFDRYASRIKEGGVNANRVVIEHACDLDVTTGMAGLYAGKLNVEGVSSIKDFGIESIRFDAEVLLEWGKKDMKQMEIALKALKGVFTIGLNPNLIKLPKGRH